MKTMKTLVVNDSHCGALEAAAKREGRSAQELHDEAITIWLAEAAQDEADLDELLRAKAEAEEKGTVEFEALFAEILGDED